MPPIVWNTEVNFEDMGTYMQQFVACWSVGWKPGCLGDVSAVFIWMEYHMLVMMTLIIPYFWKYIFVIGYKFVEIDMLGKKVVT